MMIVYQDVSQKRFALQWLAGVFQVSFNPANWFKKGSQCLTE
jgi:hypothetical protein